MKNKSKTIADCPNLAKLFHPTKNGDANPENIATGSHKKYWWKCYDGKWPDGTFADDHEWQATVQDVKYSLQQGANGCACCDGKKIIESNCLQITHPEIAILLHPTKNGDITARNITSGSGKKYWWKCYDGKWPDGIVADDHEWLASVYSIVRSVETNNNGCACCKGFKVVESNCLQTTHPKAAILLHPTKNGDITAQYITFGSNIKYWWKCYNGKWPDGTFADDHEWQAPVSNIVNSVNKGTNGCACCDGRKTVKSNCCAVSNPHLIAECHEENKLALWQFTAGSNKKIKWKCQYCSYEWVTTVGNRAILKRDCPNCIVSKGEKEIQRILDKMNLKWKSQQTFEWCRNIRKLPFDLCVFLTNTILVLVEFNGEQHYEIVYWSSSMSKEKAEDKLKKIQKHDKIKDDRTKENNVHLLVIPYWDFKNIETIMTKCFKEVLLCHILGCIRTLAS